VGPSKVTGERKEQTQSWSKNVINLLYGRYGYPARMII
jgi:hypothetical protein